MAAGKELRKKISPSQQGKYVLISRADPKATPVFSEITPEKYQRIAEPRLRYLRVEGKSRAGENK